MLWEEDGEEEDRECCGRRKIGSAVGGWGGGR